MALRGIVREAGVAAAAVAVLALLASPLLADQVETLAGKIITGKVLEETADKVVIKTDTETVTVPRNTVRSISKGPDAPDPGRVAAATIQPKDATAAFNEAATAANGGNWTKAAGLLEGLLKLEDDALAPEKRLAATQALAVCYLQLKSPSGAGMAFARAAELTQGDKEKKRVGAVVEALKTSRNVAIRGSVPVRYEDALAAASQLKAEQILAVGKESAAHARFMNKMTNLDRIAIALQDKLKEADTYVPNYYTQHRKEVLAALVANMVDGGKTTVKTCTELREGLGKYRKVSMVSVAWAREFNKSANTYLETLDMAEDTLKNVKPFTEKYEVADLYNDGEVRSILGQLDRLHYWADGKKIELRALMQH